MESTGKDRLRCAIGGKLGLGALVRLGLGQDMAEGCVAAEYPLVRRKDGSGGFHGVCSWSIAHAILEHSLNVVDPAQYRQRFGRLSSIGSLTASRSIRPDDSIRRQERRSGCSGMFARPTLGQMRWP